MVNLSAPERIERTTTRRYMRNKHNRTVGILALALMFMIAALMSACDDGNGAPTDAVAGNIITIAGQGGQFDYTGDGGMAINARLGFCTGIATDPDGNVFVTDGAANVVRKIRHSDGQISTVAGVFLGFNADDPTPHAGDGGPASSAHLRVPYGIASDRSGNIYIADAGNNAVRKIDAATGTISLFAGSYTHPPGYNGDGGPAAAAVFHTPYDVAVDQSGNVFIVDKDNHVIRRVDAGTGNISTVAGIGIGGYAGDEGKATEAQLNTPMGIALGANGDLYIADAGNHVIRRVDVADGKIYTFAGTGVSGFSSDNGPATAAMLASPTRIALDASGNLLIADHGNHIIRRVDTDGKITSIAGTGIAGYSGDGGPATEAQLSLPHGIAIDASGNILIADNGNSAIRAIAPK